MSASEDKPTYDEYVKSAMTLIRFTDWKRIEGKKVKTRIEVLDSQRGGVLSCSVVVGEPDKFSFCIIYPSPSEDSYELQKEVADRTAQTTPRA